MPGTSKDTLTASFVKGLESTRDGEDTFSMPAACALEIVSFSLGSPSTSVTMLCSAFGDEGRF